MCYLNFRKWMMRNWCRFDMWTFPYRLQRAWKCVRFYRLVELKKSINFTFWAIYLAIICTFWHFYKNCYSLDKIAVARFTLKICNILTNDFLLKFRLMLGLTLIYGYNKVELWIWQKGGRYVFNHKAIQEIFIFLSQ